MEGCCMVQFVEAIKVDSHNSVVGAAEGSEPEYEHTHDVTPGVDI
jgi:hypothetical protein